MGRHLFTVEDAFAIRQRGVIVVPGITPEDGEVFRIGDPLELRRPDGTRRRTTIAGIEMFGRRDLTAPVPILLPKDITKDDVPIGTEVWSA